MWVSGAVSVLPVYHFTSTLVQSKFHRKAATACGAPSDPRRRVPARARARSSPDRTPSAYGIAPDPSPPTGRAEGPPKGIRGTIGSSGAWRSAGQGGTGRWGAPDTNCPIEVESDPHASASGRAQPDPDPPAIDGAPEGCQRGRQRPPRIEALSSPGSWSGSSASIRMRVHAIEELKTAWVPAALPLTAAAPSSIPPLPEPKAPRGDPVSQKGLPQMGLG
jgi:hypothetical protein